jgi:hypothetical protein
MIEKFARPSVHKNVVLVGHKCDLNEKRKITSEQGKEFANKNGWLFFETSAKENINVTETFMAAARMGVHKLQLETRVVRCLKFNPAAVLGPRWEVVWVSWAGSNGCILSHGKTKEQALDSAVASTISISGSKCKILGEYEGSYHILVFSDEVHHALCPRCCVYHNSEQKIQKLCLSFDDSKARGFLLASPSVAFPFLLFTSCI